MVEWFNGHEAGAVWLDRALVYGRVLIKRPGMSALGKTGHIADIVKSTRMTHSGHPHSRAT